MGRKELAESLLVVLFVLGVAFINMPCQMGDHHPSSILVEMLSYPLLIVPIQLAFFLCLALLLFGHRFPEAITNAMAFVTCALAVAYALICLLFLTGKQWGWALF